MLQIGFEFFSWPTRYLADYCLACSYQAGADRFGRKVVEGKRFAVLNNGIELSKYRFDEKTRYEYRNKLGLGESDRALCHIGRFAREKNHRFLIEAFALAVESDPSLRLFLIGRGPLEKEVASQVDSLGIKDHVVFLGMRDDVPALLSGMDGFVFPSTWEGLGIAALEAQASGLPCLLSPELPEIAFCTPGAKRIPTLNNPSAWAEEMLLLPTCQYVERISGVDYVKESGFDVSETVSMLETLYSEHRLEAV